MITLKKIRSRHLLMSHGEYVAIPYTPHTKNINRNLKKKIQVNIRHIGNYCTYCIYYIYK